MKQYNTKVKKVITSVYKPIQMWTQPSFINGDLMDYYILPNDIVVSLSTNNHTIVVSDESNKEYSKMIYSGKDLDEAMKVIADNIKVS